MKTKKTTKAKARPVEQAPAAPASVTPAVAVLPVSAPAAKPALMRTRLLTPAQKVTAELIRFLKIHTKRPYGKRGQKAILDLAVRATNQAQQEQKTLLEVVPVHQRTFVSTALARLQQDQLSASTTAAN